MSSSKSSRAAPGVPAAASACSARAADSLELPPRPPAPPRHLHLVGTDLGGVAIAAFLVLPLARAQSALNIDLRAFAQVLGGDLAQPSEQCHVVPLGAFLLFT